ncbi:MAG: glycoside hydrolase family 16 protein [Bacteroidetes bacterium]|nr:glycoside hydrolase family 16 protein [Bacteroidota bacterium]
MNSLHQIYFLIVVLASAYSCKKPSEVGGCQFEDSLDSYEMVWNDEFDGDVIDTEKWSYDLGDGCDISPDLCGWGNNELQYYTDRSENAYVSNGNLIIRAIKENPPYLGEHQYTSARLVTKNKGDWKYGRMDIRARLPIGQGLWPAIWMLPTDTIYGGWPKSGEIDIMEYIGQEPSRVFGTIHYGNENWQYNSQGLELESGTFNDDFHVFSVIWNENCIQFQMDGINVGDPNTRSTTLPQTFPFDQRFHMLLNVAVGGNLPGNPDATTSFPQVMQVDYVRVYQKK